MTKSITIFFFLGCGLSAFSYLLTIAYQQTAFLSTGKTKIFFRVRKHLHRTLSVTLVFHGVRAGKNVGVHALVRICRLSILPLIIIH